MSSVRSPPIGESSRIASFIPKTSEYIFNALTPKSSSLSSSSSASSSSSTVAPSSMTTTSLPEVMSNSVVDTDSGDGSETSPSFFNYFIRFILVIVLLAFAGFNIFTQMGVITDDAKNFIEPVLHPIMKALGMITEQTVKSTAEGTKVGIDIVSGATKSGVNVVEDQLIGSGIRPSGNGDAKQERARANALTMKTGVDSAISQPEADDASSVTQKGKVSGKAGYCLVGEDRGIRSCVKVGEGDTCMSGNIFPSKDVCINPSLRV
jgi:hypothetical protein